MKTLSWMFTLVGALLAGGSLAMAARMVQKGVPEVPGVPTPLNCGGVQGAIGRIGTWTTDPTGDGDATRQVSTGEYGGQWGGEQFQHTGPVTGSKTDKIHHRWEKKANGDRMYLSMSATSTPVFEGSSELLDTNSPGWWWIATVHVYQQRPVMRYRVGNGAWQNPALDPDADQSNDTGHASGGEFDAPQAGPPPTPGDDVSSSPAPTTPPTKYPVPPGHSHWQPNRPKYFNPVTNPKPCNYPESEGGYKNGDPHDAPLGGGDYFAVTSQKLPSGATEAEVELQLDVNATLDVDNAKVVGWKDALRVVFVTESHESKP